MSYKNEIRALVVEIAPDVPAGAIVIEENGGFVIINWPTSMLLTSEQRAMLKTKAQALLPPSMKNCKVSIT